MTTFLYDVFGKIDMPQAECLQTARVILCDSVSKDSSNALLEVLMQRGNLNHALFKTSDTVLLPSSEEGQGERAHGYFNMHSLKCEGMPGKKGCRLVYG